MLIANFYPIIGGGEQQAQKLCVSLMKKDFSVMVLTSSHRRLPLEEKIDGIPVVRTRIRYFILKLIALKHQFDIIHVHLGYEPAVMAVIAAKLLGKKCIVKIGNSNERFDLALLKKNFFGGTYLRVLKKGLDNIISISGPITENLKEAGFLQKDIVEIPNGVEMEPVSPESLPGLKTSLGYHQEDIIIVFAGRLIQAKNIMGLLEAWKSVINELTELNMKLVVLGEGVLAENARGFAASNGLLNTVSFKGNVNNVKEYLRISDLFILPSFVEGLSNSLLEAMSFKRHCLVSEIAAHREFIDEECVSSFDPAKSSEIASLIVDSINNRDKYKKIPENAFKKIQLNFSMDRVTQKYIDLYSDLSKAPK